MIPKLEVDGVSYSYHSLDGETLALDHISFDVSPGEFLAIVGPSGTGGQYHNAVSHADGLRQVMGHQYGGLVCLTDNGADVVAHRQPGLVIQG